MVPAKCWHRRHADAMSPAILALLVVLSVSALCGGWISSRKPAEKPVKIMMFIGYFWVLTFLQLLLLALLYFIAQRFFHFESI